MDYLVYFVGPFILALIGVILLRERPAKFFIGFAAFFLAWIICQTISGISLTSLHLTEGAFMADHKGLGCIRHCSLPLTPNPHQKSIKPNPSGSEALPLNNEFMVSER